MFTSETMQNVPRNHRCLYLLTQIHLGFTMLLWYNIVQWPQDEYRPFLDAVRKTFRDKRTHAYLKSRLVYGRKPEAA